jgi:F-type H+-transporting ATPase subunit delta
MTNLSIPRRYARALLSAATESAADLDQIHEQLEELVALLQNPQLREVATHPSYTRAERRAVIDRLMDLLGMRQTLGVNLVKLLVDRDRLSYLPDIARLFRDQADAASGRVRGKWMTAVPVDPGLMKQLERNLEKLTQRKVALEAQVIPAMLGGAAARIGALLYDGSLRSQLEDLRQRLKKA